MKISAQHAPAPPKALQPNEALSPSDKDRRNREDQPVQDHDQVMWSPELREERPLEHVQEVAQAQELRKVDDSVRAHDKASSLSKTQIVQDINVASRRPKGVEPNPAPPEYLQAVPPPREQGPAVKPLNDSQSGQSANFGSDKPYQPPSRREHIESLKRNFTAVAS